MKEEIKLPIRGPEMYLRRDKARPLNKRERRRILDMYIDDKFTVDYITKYLNLNKAIVEEHLFGTGKNKNFGKPHIVGIIGFEKKTAYWPKESDILTSLDPKYDKNELVGWEKEQLQEL